MKKSLFAEIPHSESLLSFTGDYPYPLNTVDDWYEVRVDGEKVAAFGPVNGRAWRQAKDMIEVTRTDLYRDKVLSIVEVIKVQSRNKKGQPSFTRDGLREIVRHEEHPTVIED